MQDSATTAPAPQEDTAVGGPGMAVSFEGFDPPESNFWRLPNNWFDIVVCFTSWAEHKVVEYILRHTWGYHEYDICKLITMDEFMHGRKRRDGSRLDAGCGMAENSIKKGIADAVAHGFLVVEVDDSDRGRIKKFYGPRMRRQRQDDEGTRATRPIPMEQASEERAATNGTPPPGTQPAPPLASSAETPSSPHARSRSRGGHSLRGQGQSLTPQDQSLMPEGMRLTPAGQTMTPHRHPLTPRRAAADPHTEKEPSGQHPRKGTRGQQTHPAAVSLSAEQHQQDRPRHNQAPSTEEGLLHRLVEEGIAPAKARALVGTYPAERILRQLSWIDARGYQNRQATLISAIERDYSPPAPRRVPTPTSGESFDAAKFYRGAYAVCPRCGSRPCACEAPRALPASLR